MATEHELIKAISEIDNVETLRSIFGAIANALRAKGINQNPIYPNEFAGLIGTIETGIDTDDATAISSDILKNKTAYARGEKLTGTLELGVDTDDADAVSTDIVNGKTAYVKGEKITGTVPEVKSGSTSLQGSVALSSPGLADTRVILTNQLTFDTLVRKGGRVQANVEGSEFGTATTDDVLSGKTFTGASGLKKTGTLVPKTGTDTSDATATASDIASGKIAYGASGKITGNVVEVLNGSNYYPGALSSIIANSDDLFIEGKFSANRLMRTGSIFRGYTPLSNFGNATAADVVAGKTFTSSAGLKVTGSYTPPSGGIIIPRTPLYVRSIGLEVDVEFFCFDKTYEEYDRYRSYSLYKKIPNSNNYTLISNIAQYPIILCFPYPSNMHFTPKSDQLSLSIEGDFGERYGTIDPIVIGSYKIGYASFESTLSSTNVMTDSVYITIEWW